MEVQLTILILESLVRRDISTGAWSIECNSSEIMADEKSKIIV